MTAVETEDLLLRALLEKPVGKQKPTKQEARYTKAVAIGVDSVQIDSDVEGEAEHEIDDSATFLIEQGLNPADWECTGFRKSAWGDPENPRTSLRYTYKRVHSGSEPLVTEEWMKAQVEAYEPVQSGPIAGDHGYLVLIGDMQFGKADGDGPEGTLKRTLDCLNEAANQLVLYRRLYPIGHVHIAWLGDHIEGFVSQGGANAWRTNLTLTEQIRLTRRVMLYAVELFAPLCERLTVVAVPGNHGETIRFAGKGVTRYDDSHDTEALISVKDATDLAPEKFGHVEYYVPDTDELIVMVNVAGTNVAHAHGHHHRPGKHFEWWKGQAFNRDSHMHNADVLVEGHLHHETIEADGDRLHIGVPAMESESTWFRHSSGTGGAPGLIVAITKDGAVPIKHTITSNTKEGV